MIQRSPMQLRLRLIALTWLSSPLGCMRRFIMRTQGNSVGSEEGYKLLIHDVVNRQHPDDTLDARRVESDIFPITAANACQDMSCACSRGTLSGMATFTPTGSRLPSQASSRISTARHHRRRRSNHLLLV